MDVTEYSAGSMLWWSEHKRRYYLSKLLMGGMVLMKKTMYSCSRGLVGHRAQILKGLYVINLRCRVG